MEKYEGKSVCGGIAIGRILVHGLGEQVVRHVQIHDITQEKERFHRALETAVQQLEHLYEQVLPELGETDAAIFRVHQLMLQDNGYRESVEKMIDEKLVNAEYAVHTVGAEFALRFRSMDDEYMQGREADVRDISKRLIGILNGSNTDDMSTKEPVIIVADDLAPSETVQLDRKQVLSFVNVHGSENSHTAILARTMNIPALIATPIPLDDSINGKLGIVDGNQGCIYIDPDAETLHAMQESLRREQEQRESLNAWKGMETVTTEGRRVQLYANIGNRTDLDMVLENDAEGIGLFRSEFIYLEREDFPTEEEQFAIYQSVARSMEGKPVIIRTLDIGADKRCAYFGMEPEENPALGLRAIRICLTRPEIFKTQLRALYRAAAYGNIAIMYPMITGINEIRRIRKIEEEVKEELTRRGVPFGTPSIGIMIETPAAVMVSRELAKEVDFFSIGTNDLTQYTLAIDRQNTKLDEFYDPHHPAILSMIRMVTENAHAENIWVGICGELGSDPDITEELLRIGVDELSVSPGQILGLRKKIMETRL